MRKVNVASLKAGESLPLDVYSSSAVCLVPRGAPLTGKVISRLARFESGVYLAESARDFIAAERVRELDPARLERGAAANGKLITLGGRRITEGADTLDPQQLDALSHGAFLLTEVEPAPEVKERRRIAQDIIAHRIGSWTTMPLALPREHAGDSLGSPHRPSKSIWPAHDLLKSWRDARVGRLRFLYSQLLAGLSVDVDSFDSIVDDLIGMLCRDQRQFPQLALLCPRAPDYLPDHALSVSTLAMASAARAGWPIVDIRLAGLTGLLHDVGMLLVPSRLRTPDEPVNDMDRNRLLQHPAYSVTLLEHVLNLPDPARCAAYRHHERDNGSGYPHGLRAADIGDLARLIAIADIAAKMNEPRDMQSSQPLPHESIIDLAAMGGSGVLNRAMVRRLVSAIGIYPVGSFVLLSNTKVAQVIRQCDDMPDRPVVRMCDQSGKATGATIDLRRHEPWDISILDGVTPAAKRSDRQPSAA